MEREHVDRGVPKRLLGDAPHDPLLDSSAPVSPHHQQIRLQRSDGVLDALVSVPASLEMDESGEPSALESLAARFQPLLRLALGPLDDVLQNVVELSRVVEPIEKRGGRMRRRIDDLVQEMDLRFRSASELGGLLERPIGGGGKIRGDEDSFHLRGLSPNSRWQLRHRSVRSTYARAAESGARSRAAFPSAFAASRNSRLFWR